MKKKITNRLIAALFAFSLALGGGFLISKSVQSESEIVLAEFEEPEEIEEPEEPTETEVDEPHEEVEEPAETTDEEENNESSQGETSTSQVGSSSTSQETSSPSVESEGLGKSILKAFYHMIKDAFKDLLRHIKAWFGF